MRCPILSRSPPPRFRLTTCRVDAPPTEAVGLRLAPLSDCLDQGCDELALLQLVVEPATAHELDVVLPCSTMRPASITTIVLALRIVESRCAVTKLVRPRRSRAIASWMRTSARVSTSGRLVT